MSPSRQYGPHRPEDTPTHVTVLKGRQDGVYPVTEVRVPIHPAMIRQRQNINNAAHEAGRA